MSRSSKPRIGVTLDAEPAGGWSKYPWYALRVNYADAVADAGGLPLMLPHRADLATVYLDGLDALIVTGGAFDIDPAIYGDATTHPTVSLKTGRTQAERALIDGAIARDMPILGICGGEQLLAALMGGTLVQHIPESFPDGLAHEQTVPHDKPCHAVAIKPQTLLHRIVGNDAMQVNSSHHQAVRGAGPSLIINAVAPDGVIEGVEHPGKRFCLGVQWHPEFHTDPGDQKIMAALVDACR